MLLGTLARMHRSADCRGETIGTTTTMPRRMATDDSARHGTLHPLPPDRPTGGPGITTTPPARNQLVNRTERISKSTEAPETCNACLGRLNPEQKECPGYKRPMSFDIANCTRCDSSMALPCKEDLEIYNIIYSRPDDFRGYERYSYYSKRVRNHGDPLDFLASSSPTYWGVRSALGLAGASSGARVLDFGCGLGYLTHALVRAGFDARGLEFSPAAVAFASRIFGPSYIQGNEDDILSRRLGLFDGVLLVEVLEHVQDPYKLLTSCKGLLKPNGFLIVTTPNKTFARPTEVWQTDLPPVHLYWFSEKGMESMAERLGMGIQLVDYSGMSRRYDSHSHGRLAGGSAPTFLPPYINEDGGTSWKGRRLERFLKLARVFNLAVMAMSRLRSAPGSSKSEPREAARRCSTMTALFTQGPLPRSVTSLSKIAKVDDEPDRDSG